MNSVVADNSYIIVFLKNRGSKGSNIPFLKSLDLLASYYKEYYGSDFEDLTFLVIKDTSIISVVLGYKIGADYCCPLDGIQILNVGTQELNPGVYTLILSHLEKLAIEFECKKIVVKDYLPAGSLSSLGEKLFNQRYHANLKFEMEIAYDHFSEDNLHKTLRKSYKSLINWGSKNLQFTYINKEHLSEEAFESFKEFHLKIAGRSTRSNESWSLQYEMITQGFGELILANYNDKLAAGSLFVDYGIKSTYFTGVYERDLFEFGISHSLLYKGICRSYERGNTLKFSLGHFDTNIQDPKWYNIQFFKKGFSESLTPEILWEKETSYE